MENHSSIYKLGIHTTAKGKLRNTYRVSRSKEFLQDIDREKTELLIIDVQPGYSILLNSQLLTILERTLCNLIQFCLDQNIHITLIETKGYPRKTIKSIQHVLQGQSYDCIKKNDMSAFNSTRLHENLKKRGVQNIIYTGLFGRQCVMASFLDGVQYGFQPIIVNDGIADYSHQPLEYLHLYHQRMPRINPGDKMAGYYFTSAELLMNTMKAVKC